MEASLITMTAAEYLAWEREQQGRHEFVDGAVYAMTGGSPRHNAIKARLSAILIQAVGSGCAPLSSNQKIGVRADVYYYADASVVCGDVETDAKSRDVVTNPSVLIEVLSKSTMSFDRGDKWRAYRQLRSLQDYLLVSQWAAEIEHYQRRGDVWLFREYDQAATISLATGAVLRVDEIYDGVWRFPSDEAF